MALAKLNVTKIRGNVPSSPEYMLDTSRMINVYSRAGTTVIEYLFRKDKRETPKEIEVSETTIDVNNQISLGKNGYVDTTTTFKGRDESSKSTRFQTENIIYGKDLSSGSKLYVEDNNVEVEYIVVDNINTLIANAHYFSGGTLFNTEVKNKGANVAVTLAGNPNSFTYSTAFLDTNYSLVVRVYDNSGVFQGYGVPTKTTSGFTLDVTTNGFIDYLATSVTGGITDISSVAWPNITSNPTAGGTANQVLTKNSATDYDFSWTTQGATPDSTQAIYVLADNGNDSNDGLTPEKPKLTIASALTAAQAIASVSNPVVVYPNGDFSEGVNIPDSYISVYGPSTTITGEVVINNRANCSVRLYQAQNVSILNSSANNVIVDIDVLTTSLLTNGITVNSTSTGNIFVRSKKIIVNSTYGVHIQNNTTNVYFDIDKIELNVNSAIGVYGVVSTQNQVFNGTVKEIIDQGFTTTTGVKIEATSTGSVVANLNVEKIDADTAYDVDSACTLNMFVNSLTGTETNSGTANVTKAGLYEEVTERPSTQPTVVTGTPNTLTLDCNSRKAARFEPRLSVGTRTINIDFTLNLSNATNIEDIHFILSLSGTRIITFGSVTLSNSEVLGSDFTWDNTLDQLTIDAGTGGVYEFFLYKDQTSGSYLLKAAGEYS